MHGPVLLLHDRVVSRRVTVAGLTVRVDAADPVLAVAPPGFMQAFGAPAGAVDDLALEARWGDLPRETGRCLFDSGGVWRLYETEGAPRFGFAMDRDGRPYKTAALDFARGVGTVLVDRATFAREPDPPDVLEYPLDELIWSHLLARADGALLHACGVRRAGGGGDVCVAHSGGGKSTLAALLHAAGLTVLSDEHVAVRRGASGFVVHGTPWCGTAGLSANATARLERILFLEHAAEDALVPLSPALAAARLYACSYPPAHDAALAARNLDAVAALAEAVPAYALRFRPTPAVAALLEKL